MLYNPGMPLMLCCVESSLEHCIEAKGTDLILSLKPISPNSRNSPHRSKISSKETEPPKRLTLSYFK